MHTKPNPFRLFWLLGGTFIAAAGYSAWVGGTAGIPGEWLESVASRGSWIRPRNLIQFFGPSLLVAGGFGLASAAALVGPRRLLGGLRFALGSNNQRTCAQAGNSLGWAARMVTWTGVWTGALAALLVFLVLHSFIISEKSIELHDVVELHWWVIQAPMTALVLGRMVLGSLADAVGIRTGRTGKPAFSLTHDLLLFSVVCLPGVAFYFMYGRF